MSNARRGSIGLLIVLSQVCVSACSIKGQILPGNSDQPSTEPPAAPSIPRFSIKDYFYRTVGSCKGQSLYFKVLSTAGFQLQSDSSVLIYGAMDLYLKDDFTYVVDYDEYATDETAQSKRLEGGFSVDGTHINIDGLGVAEFVESEDRFGLELTFSEDILSSGLKDQRRLLRSSLRRDGLQTREEFCGLSYEREEILE